MKNKLEIKQAIIDYLDTLGYPNITPERVLLEIPNMWRLLDKSNLKPEGMSFQAFSTIVHRAYQQKKIEFELANHFKR